MENPGLEVEKIFNDFSRGNLNKFEVFTKLDDLGKKFLKFNELDPTHGFIKYFFRDANKINTLFDQILYCLDEAIMNKSHISAVCNLLFDMMQYGVKIQNNIEKLNLIVEKIFISLQYKDQKDVSAELILLNELSTIQGFVSRFQNAYIYLSGPVLVWEKDSIILFLSYMGKIINSNHFNCEIFEDTAKLLLKLLNNLAVYMTDVDTKISTKVIKVLNILLVKKYFNCKFFIKDPNLLEIIEKIVVALNVIADGKLISKLLGILVHYSSDEKIALSILSNEIDIELIYSFCRNSYRSIDILDKLMRICEVLLPYKLHELSQANINDAIKHVNSQTEKRTLFATIIQPFLESLIIDHIGCEEYCLQLYACIMLIKNNNPLRENEIIHAICSYVNNPYLAKWVLLIAQAFIAKYKKCYITNELNYSFSIVYLKLDENDKYKAGQFLDTVSQHPHERNDDIKITINNICNVVDTIGLSYLYQINDNVLVIDELNKSIDSCFNEKFKIDSNAENCFQRLVNICLEVLNSFPVIENGNWTDFNSLFTLFLCSDEGQAIPFNKSVQYTNDFAELEAMIYSSSVSSYNNLLEQSIENGAYYDIKSQIEFSSGKKNEFNSYVCLDILSRSFSPIGFKTFQFTVDNYDLEFSITDSIYQAISSAVQSNNEITGPHYLYFFESEEIQRSPLKIRDLNSYDNPTWHFSNIQPFLILLNKIHKLFMRSSFNLNMISDSYAKHIWHNILDFSQTNGLFSFSSQLILQYPFLFPFDLRMSFFKMTALSTRQGLIEYESLISGKSKTKLDSMVFKCHSERIFEDGITYLKHFAASNCQTHILFYYGNKDNGFGLGPRNQFFSLLGQEFTKKKLGLWICDNDYGDDEYAEFKQGLFLRPDANIELVQLFGTFCAKCLFLGCVFDIDLSPSFWKYLRGMDIEFSELYPDISKNFSESYINDDDTGYPFVFPVANCEIELIEDGDDHTVTSSGKYSIENYLKLIREKWFENNAIRNAFITGFNVVIQWTALDIFSIEELPMLFAGNKKLVSYQDMEKYVDIKTKGYTKESQLIKNLFTVVAEMDIDNQRSFFRFVTGYHSLPYGGLEKLDPHLNVQIMTEIKGKTVDEDLPTAHTCTFSLAIPGYTSKDDLKNRLLFAIGNSKEINLS